MRIDVRPPGDRLLDYWKKERPTVAGIVFFGLLFNTTMTLASVFQGRLIDAIVSGEPLRQVLYLCVFFVLLVSSIQTARYFKRNLIRIFANRTSGSLRRAIYRSLLSRDLGAIEGESVGNLMTHALSDVDLCVEGMRKFTTEVFDTGVLLAAYVATLLVYDVKITLLSILSVPLAMIIADRLKVLIYKYTVAWRKKNSQLADFTWNSVEHLLLYRIKGLEGAILTDYRKELVDLEKKAVRANILEDTMQPVYNAIAMLGVTLVIALGGEKVLGGHWTVGQFSAYLTIYAAMAVKASKASKLFNSVQKSRVSWNRIQPYLKQEEPPSQGLELPLDRIAQSKAEPRLSVSNLSLRYPGSPVEVIAGISFTGKAGELIGVTGKVASGKSSLALALTGLYPYGGSIRIDGNEVAALSPEERSRAISWQGHRSELLPDSILNNITLGKGGDISKVIRDTSLETDLGSMSEGVHTLVGSGGVRLSGGQQARVALSRALFGEKNVIILDDPFSAVDVRTEEEIVNRLREGYRDSLIIIVSHRLTLFPKADKVLLLHSDTPCELGTHESLMETSHLYREIFSLQCALCEDADA